MAEPEKVIEPNDREYGVLKVGVTRTRCTHSIFNEKTQKQETCKAITYWIRYQYKGGWGPIGKARQETNASWAKRIKEGRESQWVWGYDPETFAKKKVMVR
jgi:hypothetical protein